jgi:3-oxoacyl-[acyl-carrier-protein] synthase-3
MGTRIRGILAVVPGNVRSLAQVAAVVGPEDAERVAQLTGVREVRLCDPGQTAFDLIEAAAARLLSELGVPASEVGGVVLLTQTPDFILPASACILQHRLGLPKTALAFDVNQGCSSFPYGMAIGHALVISGLARRLLVVTGDNIPSRVHPEDRASLPLFGAAAAATLIEHEDGPGDILGLTLGTDGAGGENLIIPVGQSRYPTVEAFQDGASARLKRVPYPAHLFMDGNSIFTFTLREVPALVSRALERGGKRVEDVDYFLFHQANKFILEHLIKKLKLPLDRCPMSIESFGNTSGASPAVTACHCLYNANQAGEFTALFVGFGVGYSWGGALVRLRQGTLFPLQTLPKAD